MIRVCYLGLNRFNYDMLDSNIEFVNQSLKIFKNDRDFFYYSCVFNIYKNDYTNVYCNSSNIIKTIPKDIINSREIFLYYKTLSSNFELFEDSDLQDSFKNQLLNEISKDSLEFANCDNFETKLKNEKATNNNKNKNNSNNEFILYSPFIIDFYSLVSFSFYLISINNKNNNNNMEEEDASSNKKGDNNINNYKLSIEYYNLACNYHNQLKSKLQSKTTNQEDQLLSKELYVKRIDYLESILSKLKIFLNQ
ncbi:hypothetical protein DICPUDRAFT_91895 [Dictyostelium purpureum]|uniref:Uncharacterized protein n=1 Tax=Dictyostelium purpureum TaxID=5786 RepID=F0ZIU8_DICPU|nr:uncharacterized protein DICPUDRAFT_91895 [Dictyostelium purpureum]EGC36152.1 hypothetical protein DICPUDRAFT_91895 [Dictyostelium purpureum]|eukprot:XP_003287345.1 hypothetical protein DICPUDRAFT_91895 [Dictyostelium purpureum]